MLMLLPLVLVLAVADQDPSSSAADIQRDNAATAKRMAERIKGREDEPAGTVFRNVRIAWLRTAPAGLFLEIMEGGYAKALGVRCTHCHVQDDFASDEKRPKRAAREMAIMHKAINDQLSRMQHLRGTGDERFINCSTCHRGAVDPHDPQP